MAKIFDNFPQKIREKLESVSVMVFCLFTDFISESEDEAAARVRFVKKRTIKEKMRLAKVCDLHFLI